MLFTPTILREIGVVSWKLAVFEEVICKRLQKSFVDVKELFLTAVEKGDVSAAGNSYTWQTQMMA